MKNPHSSPLDQLKAANPWSQDAVEAIVAERQLAETLEAFRSRISGSGRQPARPASLERRFGPRRLAAGFAVVTATAFALIGLSLLADSGSDGNAWAAEDIEFAKRTPQLLLAAPGWNVTYVDQYGPGNTSGELEYELRGSSLTAGVFWTPASLYKGFVRDRAHDAHETRGKTGDGNRARVFYSYNKNFGGPNTTSYSAVWLADRASHRFEVALGGSPSRAQRARFRTLLRKVKAVRSDTWLRAMPASVLLPSELPAASKRILADVPKPDGFSTDAVLGNLSVSTEDQLRFRLISAVECVWIGDWLTARRKGDQERMQSIVTQLSGYKTWRYRPPSSPDSTYIPALSNGGKMDLDHGLTRDVSRDYKAGLGCDPS